MNKRKLFLCSFFTAVSLTTAVASIAALSHNTNTLNSALNSANNNVNADSESESKETRSFKEEDISFRPIAPIINHPQQVSVNNASLLPTFSIGSSTNFTFRLNQSSSLPAISFAGTNFNLPFKTTSPSSSVPLNESTDGINTGNVFIGCQIYNRNGVLQNKNNYGSVLNQSYSNPDGKQIIVDNQFSTINDVVINPSQIGIFSIQNSTGVKTSLGSSTLGLWKMNEPVNNSLQNWEILHNEEYIPSTIFQYNLIIQNDGSNYHFYAPDASTSVSVSYNGVTGQQVGVSVEGYTASQYVRYLLSNRDEQLKFKLRATNSLATSSEYQFILHPDDENGILKVDVFVPFAISKDGSVYKIESSKLYQDVITLTGFNIDSSQVTLFSQQVIDWSSAFDESTKQNSLTFTGIDGVNKSFNISSRYSQIVKLNLNSDGTFASPALSIVDWPTSTDFTAAPFNSAKPYKLLNFPNVNEKIIYPYLNSNVLDYNKINYATGRVNANAIPYISKYRTRTVSLSESSYCVDASQIPQSSSNQQWLTIETAALGPQNLFYSAPLSLNFNGPNGPDVYNNNPVITADDLENREVERYYQTFVNSGEYFSKIPNDPVAINIKVRNDYYSNDPTNGEGMFGFDTGVGDNSNADFSKIGSMDGRYGSNLITLPGQSTIRFQYLSGIVSNYGSNVYWMAPTQDTRVICDAETILDKTQISEYTPSVFLENHLFGQKLNIKVNGGIVNTLSEMQINAYPNDVAGTIKFIISPGVGVETNIANDSTDTKEYGFKHMEPIEVTVSGFKRSGFLYDTQVVSTDYNISDFSSEWRGAYITTVVNNYLKSSQNISSDLLNKKYEILADVINRNFKNVYNINNNKLITTHNGNQISDELRNQVSNVNISIPAASEYIDGGYNHLNLSFDLRGVAVGNTILNQSKHYEIKLFLKLPEKVATVINPKLLLAVDSENEDEQITAPQIKSIIDDRTTGFKLLNLMLTGYKDPSKIGEDVEDASFTSVGETSTFSVPFRKFSNGVLVSENRSVEVVRRELAYGYPSDFYEYYIQSDKPIGDDELLPKNSWEIKDVSLNESSNLSSNQSVNVTLGLKYYVTSNGIITYKESGKEFNVELVGKNQDNRTTTLTQNIFSSPSNQILASDFKNQMINDDGGEWNIIKRNILNSIINLPAEESANNISNIGYIPDSIKFNNVDGILTFNVGLHHAIVNGVQYNAEENNNQLYDLGTVTINSFKLGKVTILRNEFTATITMTDNYGNDILPSEISPSDLNYSQLCEILRKQAFIDLPSSATLAINNGESDWRNGIIFDNINGKIIINPKKDGQYDNVAKVWVDDYWDEHCNLQQNKQHNFAENQSIVINGFKKTPPTSLRQNNYVVNSNESILRFDESKSKEIVGSLLENIPTDFNWQEDIVLDNFTKHVSVNDINNNTVRITFDVYIKYGYAADGHLVDDRATNTLPSINLGSFVISGFKAANVDTSTNESLYINITDFAPYISSNYVNFDAGTSQNGYEIDASVEEKIVSTIINSLQTSSPYIDNAPIDIRPSEIIIKARSSDNTEGLISIYVYMKRYYANGNLQESEQGHFIGLLNVSGFKVLPKEATSLNSNSFLVTGSYAEDDESLINETKAAEIISVNAPSIFLNLPSNTGPTSSNSLDNPTFNTTNQPPFNVIVENLQTSAGSFNFNMSINSYFEYTDDVSKGKVVWVNGKNKNLGNFTVNGIKGWQNTTISSRLDLNQFNTNNQYSDIIAMIASDVSKNTSVMERIKQFIYENGISHWNESAQPWTNYLTINNVVPNNALGELSVSISISSYVKDGLPGNYVSNPLTGTIIISGFTPAQPTTINSTIKVSNPYNSMYPFQLTDDDQIKDIILQNINNRPGSLTKADIVWSSIERNNFLGNITIKGLRLLRNYYDENSNLSETPQSFGNILLTNFLSAGGPTEIRNQYNVNSRLLPFQYWKTPSFEFNVKELIKNQLISNPAPNLDSSDINISNIHDNNISGSLSMTVELSKYFDESGRLIDASGDSDTQRYKKQDVVLNQFATTVATKFTSTLSVTGIIENSEEMSAKQFLSQSNALEILNNLVLNNCFIGKWSGYDASNISISDPVVNNLEGKITINVTANAWIDESGAYREDVPLEQTITFTGFKQLQVTYISSRLEPYTGNNIAQTMTDDEIKQFVFDRLVINKSENMTIDDIQLVPGSKKFNNATGRLSIKVQMLRNYYDENGELATTPSKEYDVNISLIKNAAPTSIMPTFDISNISAMSQFKSYDFLTQKNSDGSINYDAIKNVIFENLFNFNDSSKMVLQNYPSQLPNESDNLTLTDINIDMVEIENGMELLAIPQDGSMVLTVSLNKYFDSDTARLVIVGQGEDINASPKSFQILVTGFQPVNGGTIVPNEIDINEVLNPEDYSNTIASNNISYSTSSPIARAILQSIQNWEQKDPSNIQITNLVADNTIGAITATFRIKDFENEDGVVFESWSNDYTILIKGFKIITPTTLNDINILASGEIGSELANVLNADSNFFINERENFSVLNLAQISQNRYFNIFIANTLFKYVSNNLSDLIINPTPEVASFFSGSFSYSAFSKYFAINNISIDNLSGNLTFNLNLLNYYSSLDGNIVQNNNPLSCFVTISGFYKSKVTVIKSSVKTNLLSDIIASDWTTSNGKQSLKRFIFNNKDLFIENPSYNFEYIDIVGIDDIVANNLIGELSFKLTIDNYFGSDGKYHNNDVNNTLSSIVSLRGFKMVGATTMTQLIDVSENNIFGVDSIEELTPSIIRSSLYQFRFGSEGIEPIFNNLPEGFNESSIIVDEKDKWTINYKNGSLVVPVQLLRYNNSDGQVTTNNPKSLNVSIVGFDPISSATTVYNEVDISFIYELDQSLTSDVGAEMIQFLLTSNAGLLTGIGNYHGIFNILPKTFEPITDIKNLNIDHREADYITISFQYKNIFVEKGQDLAIDDSNWNQATVKLVGFKQLEDTKITGEVNYQPKIVWDLSNTAASQMYVGDVTTYDLNRYANEVKKNYIQNPATNAAGQIITNVVIKDILEKDGVNGSIVANVQFDNYVNNSTINNNAALDTEIEFIGFNLHNVTSAVSETIDTDINEIPSLYLKSSNDLIDKLNNPINLNKILGDTSLVIGSKKTEVVDILGIDGLSFSLGGKIEINDQEGLIRCKLSVKNTYNRDGTITSTPTVLKNSDGTDAIIEIKTNTVLLLSSLKQPINLDSSYFDNAPSTADIFSPTASQIKSVLVSNINNYINLGEIRASGNTRTQEINEQKIQIDVTTRQFNNKEGKVWYTSGVLFTEWWTVNSNSNLRNQNNPSYNSSFTDDSVVFTTNSSSPNIPLSIVGFEKINYEQNQTTIYLLAGLVGGLILILLIVIFVWFFRKRNRIG